MTGEEEVFEDELDIVSEGDAEDEVEETLIFCWRDANRACGPECTAYDARALEDDRFSTCMILNTERASSRSYAVIGQELKRLNDAAAVGTKKTDSEAYAAKLKELDKPPPEVKT